jgi:hypothetical protein
MKLHYALLCDYAFLSVDKKVNIIGVFETINARQFPVVHPRFVIVGSISPSKNKFKMSLNIVDESGSEILQDLQEREVNLPKENANNFNFIVEVINANFAKPGNYKVEIKIDGKLVGDIDFKVMENKMDIFGPPS